MKNVEVLDALAPRWQAALPPDISHRDLARFLAAQRPSLLRDLQPLLELWPAPRTPLVAAIEAVTNTQIAERYPPVVSVEDWGRRPRGQGRRVGGMITGGMADISVQGKKSYSDPIGNVLDLTPEDRISLQAMQGALASRAMERYLRARVAGHSNDVAMLYTLMAEDHEPPQAIEAALRRAEAERDELAPAEDENAVVAGPAATVTRFVGLCPICEGEFKLTVERRLVHHGYQRPGWGSIVGDCFAVGAPPYEISCEITKTYRSLVEVKKARAEAWLGRLKRGEVSELPIGRRRMVTPTSPEWPSALSMAIMEAEGAVSAAGKEIERVSGLIDRWVLRPLRTVDEMAGATKAQRDAKTAKLAAARATKLAEKVASYQRRLDTAVRNKTPSTIADVFESAPNKLQDMAKCSRAEAFALLNRDHVFTAFDLQLSPPHWSTNDRRLGEMRYNFDKTFVWPAALELPERKRP